jgi:quinoprotein glucose dehydrogenase
LKSGSDFHCPTHFLQHNLFKPPYGRITAINLNTGEHVWQAPNGDWSRREVNEILRGLGVNKDVGPLGAGGSGPLLTKT